MLKVYNTLTRKKEIFVPLFPPKVTMYVCGPTVYNYIHIGNARSAVAFDTIRRYLIYSGYKVRFVSNFTDVDDKMIRRAAKENISVKELADRYIGFYNDEIKKLNVMPATVRPRATSYISKIIEFIKHLINSGYAYQSGGDVYFHTRKFVSYGKLSDQSLNELMVGASEHTNELEQKRKKDPLDFALWKGRVDDEIYWNSPFGPGRPGWHIECSVMAISELGNTIDIHGGGEDLKFPHHENERAQSEAETGEKFVKYWLHNAFVTVNDDEKMSKSAGNFLTLHEALKKYEPNFLRFFLVQTNYRKPLPYGMEQIVQAQRNYQRIMNGIYNLNQAIESASKDEESSNIAKQIQQFEHQFKKAMDDDFNVQNALTVIFDYLKWLNKSVIGIVKNYNNLKEIKENLIIWLQILGIQELKTDEITDPEVISLINQRDAARKSKNFALSDKLRDELIQKGISIEDTSKGTKYRKK